MKAWYYDSQLKEEAALVFSTSSKWRIEQKLLWPLTKKMTQMLKKISKLTLLIRRYYDKTMTIMSVIALIQGI
jgi:hypothetical protein